MDAALRLILTYGRTHGYKEVSILVLVDAALRQQTCTSVYRQLLVSILVLVDAALRQDISLCQPGGVK